LENLTYSVNIPHPNPPPEGEGIQLSPFSPGGKGWDRGIEQKIHQVIKLAKCEFIYDFKDGLNTEI
jgi:hypothetical protein